MDVLTPARHGVCDRSRIGWRLGDGPIGAMNGVLRRFTERPIPDLRRIFARSVTSRVAPWQDQRSDHERGRRRLFPGWPSHSTVHNCHAGHVEEGTRRSRRAVDPLLATALDPAVPARADAVEVIAARLGTVTIEVHPDQAAVPAASAAGAHVGERREVCFLDGRGRHGRVYHGGGDDEGCSRRPPDTRHADARVARLPRPRPAAPRMLGGASSAGARPLLVAAGLVQMIDGAPYLETAPGTKIRLPGVLDAPPRCGALARSSSSRSRRRASRPDAARSRHRPRRRPSCAPRPGAAPPPACSRAAGCSGSSTARSSCRSRWRAVRWAWTPRRSPMPSACGAPARCGSHAPARPPAAPGGAAAGRVRARAPPAGRGAGRRPVRGGARGSTTMQKQARGSVSECHEVLAVGD